MSILLGIPGEYTSASDVNQYSTKVGGSPALPNDLNIGSSIDSLIPPCASCHKPMSLVFQAHAPLSAGVVGRDLNDRLLLVFACLQEACAKDTKSWSVLRLQREPAAAEPRVDIGTETSAAAAGSEAAASAAYDDPYGVAAAGAGGADDWGLGGGDDWGLSGGGGGGGGGAALDMSALNRALEEASAAPSVQAEPSASRAPAPAGGDAQWGPRSQSLGPECLPEFHVMAEAEPDSAGPRGGGKAGRDKGGEDDHIARLIAAYEAEEARVGSGGDAGPAVVAPPEAVGGEPDEAAAATWTGEAYEEDLARWAAAPYIKFLERLKRRPDQIARYGYGQQLLWPGKERPAAPCCTRCGADRSPELQLMSPLIAALEEASDYMEAEYEAKVVRPPEAWDWATVAVFTCSKSCRGGETEGEAPGGWVVSAEHAVAAQE